MMKRWLSATRVNAASMSSRSGRYCACKSSSGTFIDASFNHGGHGTDNHGGHGYRQPRRSQEEPGGHGLSFFRSFLLPVVSVSSVVVIFSVLRPYPCPRWLPPGFDRRTRLAIGLSPLDRFPLVVFFLALRQAHGHFHTPVFEVHAHRDERHPFLDRLAGELANLLAVQQELPPAQRLVLRVAAMPVGADVHVVEEHLAVLEPGKAVTEVHASFADRLDLGAEQHDAGFVGIEDVEIVVGLAVFRDVGLRELSLRFLFCHPALPAPPALPCLSCPLTRRAPGVPRVGRPRSCSLDRPSPSPQYRRRCRGPLMFARSANQS